MAKKINTGTDLMAVKNTVGVAVVSIMDDDMVMIRSEVHDTVLLNVVISKQAAIEIGKLLSNLS